MIPKRLFDLLCSAVALAVLSPLLGALAVFIWLEDRGPVWYRGQRVGLGGKPFRIFKFRSMVINAEKIGGPSTADGDPRITRVGRFVRKYKLDEWPQLINVVIGDMSLVGPRPEVPQYVEYGDPRWKQVLSVRPGITDLATLVYRDEEEILAGAGDPDLCYRSQVLPRKLALNLEYLGQRTLATDLRLLALTARYSFVPDGFRSDEIRTKVMGAARGSQ